LAKAGFRKDREFDDVPNGLHVLMVRLRQEGRAARTCPSDKPSGSPGSSRCREATSGLDGQPGAGSPGPAGRVAPQRGSASGARASRRRRPTSACHRPRPTVRCRGA
jgi:hypothetical protein